MAQGLHPFFLQDAFDLHKELVMLSGGGFPRVSNGRGRPESKHLGVLVFARNEQLTRL